LASLWQLRSRCALALGDTEGAVSDLTYFLIIDGLTDRQASKLTSTAEVNLLLSNLLFYSLNDVESALNSVKKCLHQDPENKECKKEFRTLKNASKSLTQIQAAIDGEQWHQATRILITQRFREQINTQVTQLKQDGTLKPNSPNRLLAQLEEWSCQAYSNVKKHNVAIRHCDLALDLNPDSIPSLIGKANYFLQEESYDQAIQLLNKANELTGGQNQHVRQQLERAQRLLRQSKKKDYYKIIGVPRDSDSKAIRKAYRNLSKQYHPDKYRGDLDEESVSRKMAEINSAYEVLSNEGISPLISVLMVELRTRYDNGDDPNDHEGQQGYPGGNPFMFQQGGQNFFFQQNGNPFQGGQFKFHF
jgi:DnaJ homolog subfamily C member 3